MIVTYSKLSLAKSGAKTAISAVKFKYGGDKIANGILTILNGMETANKYLAERYKSTFEKVRKGLKELSEKIEKRTKDGKNLTITLAVKLSNKLDKIISIAQKDARVYEKFKSQLAQQKRELDNIIDDR